MDYLIIRNQKFKKVAFSKRSDVINFLEFDCAIGFKESDNANEIGQNEFMLKVKLGDGLLIPLGYYISYGLISEYAGKISERTIDLGDKTVTYYGNSIHSGVVGRHIKRLTNSGIVDEAYTEGIRGATSDKARIVFDEVSDGFDRKNKTAIYPKEQIENANLGDTIIALDVEYEIGAVGVLAEKYIHIRNNQLRIEYKVI